MEIWMNDDNLASDSDCNIVNLQGMRNNVGLALSVGDSLLRFTTGIEQAN